MTKWLVDALFAALVFISGLNGAEAQIVNGCAAGPCVKSSFNGQLNLDLVNNTGNVAPSTALTETRAGTANTPNTSGGLTSIAANTLRTGADEFLNQSAGAWIEEALTNTVSSPSFTGCTPPSTLPTGWGRSSFDGSGLTLTLTSCTATSMTFTLTGTANAAYFGLDFMSSSSVAVSVGQTWTCSAMVQASSTTGISNIGMAVVEYPFVGNFSVMPIGSVNSDIPWFASTSRTITAGTNANCALAFQTDASGTVNSTITLQRPQFEQRAWRSVFAAGTRAADAVALSSTYQTPYLAATTRSVCIGFTAPRFLAAGTIWSEFKDANNWVELRTTGSLGSNAVSLFVRSGGATISNVTLGYVPPLSTNNLCMEIAPTTIKTQLNGDTRLTTTVTAPTAMVSTALLSGQNGYLNSTVQSLKTWLRALSDAESLAASAVTPNLYDGFQRANSASLGTAPSGQSWTQSGTPAYTINSNYMITDLTAGATYGLISMGRNPVYIGSVHRFSNVAGAVASAALVAATNGPVGGVNASHMFTGPSSGIWGYIQSGAPVDVLAFNYPAATPLDGATLSGYAWFMRNFDNSVVQISPRGDTPRYVNSLIVSLQGSTLWFEAFGGGSNSVPAFKAVAAR